MKVAILSEAQKTALMEQETTDGAFFNPIRDYYSRWVISKLEIDNCTKAEYQWVRLLALTEFKPKTITWPDRSL